VVSQEQEVPLEMLVTQDQPDHLVRLDCKALLVPRDQLDHLDSLDQLANQAKLDLRVILDQQDPWVLLVLLAVVDHLGILALKDLLDQKDLLVLKETQDHRDHRDPKVIGDSQGQ